MTNRLTHAFVERAAELTTKALLDTNIFQPGERLELADSGGTKFPIRLAVFSESGNERVTLLNDCNLRRALDGIETLRALAHFAEFRIDPQPGVTIRPDQWQPVRGDDPSRPHLTGPTVTINGLPMHIEAWRVATDDQGAQSAVESSMDRDFSDLRIAVHADGPFRTTTIGEFDDYTFVASPACDPESED